MSLRKLEETKQQLICLLLNGCAWPLLSLSRLPVPAPHTETEHHTIFQNGIMSSLDGVDFGDSCCRAALLEEALGVNVAGLLPAAGRPR